MILERIQTFSNHQSDNTADDNRSKQIRDETIDNLKQKNGNVIQTAPNLISNIGSLEKLSSQQRAVPPSLGNIKCDHCSHVAVNKHVMELHMKHVHQKRFVCEHCNYSTGDNGWLYTHVKADHINDTNAYKSVKSGKDETKNIDHDTKDVTEQNSKEKEPTDDSNQNVAGHASRGKVMRGRGNGRFFHGGRGR